MGFWHCALYLAVIGLASSAAALLPRRWFHADRFPFRPQRWEHEGKIYEKLAVQRWKDKLPDMSRFLPWLTQKQVSASISAAQAERLVQETCVAEAVHTASSLLGLICLWLWPGWGGVVLWLIWFLLANLPFILIQRYNRPRLMRLRDLLQRREQRKGNHEHPDTDL